MSKVNSKNFIKDTNYNDFVQKEIGLNIVSERASSADVSFNIEKKSDQKLKVKFNEPRFGNQVGQLLETSELSAVPGSFGNFQLFKNYIQNNFINGFISNHYTYYEKTSNIDVEDRTQFFHYFKSKYNFYSREYQDKYFDVSERLIPNYYIQKSMFSNIKATNKNVNSETFRGSNYSINSNAEQKMRNIIVDNPKHVNSELQNYPLYIEFGFYNNSHSEIKRAIKKLGLFNNLIQDYVDNSNVSRSDFDLNSSADVSEVIQLKNYKIFSLLDWTQNQNYEINEDNKIFLNTKNKSSFYSFRVAKNILNGAMSRIINDKIRKYENIVNNDYCYNETLFYKVDKYVGNVIGTPVQTFWISSDEDAVRLVDTQVKEGQIYSYDVKSVIVIVGNKYRFSQPDYFERSGEFFCNLELTNNPSVQLVEVPYFVESFVAMQNAPMKPDINIYTKKNSDNFVYININKQIGTYAESFVPIETIDRNQQEKMNLIINLNDYNVDFYESKNVEESFEVYRLNSPPNGYSDFKDNKIMNAKTFLDNTKQNPSNVTIKDKISPNTKYYYMFRSVNINQTKSNPTIVYEVELIKDADDSMVTVKQYDFPIPKQYDNMKMFSSLFQVSPALEQVFFDQQQQSLFNATTAVNKLNQIKLGNADDSIWGRTFKIRIRSKSTGKLIDFNVNFDLNLVKTDKL